jgi:hypothetical protein
MFGNGPAFKRLTRKELYKVFPDLSEGYIDAFYDLYFWALVGLLATAHETQLHEDIHAAFQDFLEKCDELTMDAVAEATAKDTQVKMNYPIAELESWFDEHPSE